MIQQTTPKINLSKYEVSLVPACLINPSPENDDLYGEIQDDETMDALVKSIEKNGLEEPLILTEDNYILSGHRRFYAIHERLQWIEIPCRYRHDIRRGNNSEYHKALAEYNPQRVKSVGALLKEALLRDTRASGNFEGFADDGKLP